MQAEEVEPCCHTNHFGAFGMPCCGNIIDLFVPSYNGPIELNSDSLDHITLFNDQNKDGWI
jgi:hypothetical protein